MKITFIGAGNMSEAIIAGVLKQEVVAADAVTVSDPLEERLRGGDLVPELLEAPPRQAQSWPARRVQSRLHCGP